jgi:hypothetical protein
MALNITPERNAVVMPLNVPKNRIGTAIVNNTSHITCVLATN